MDISAKEYFLAHCPASGYERTMYIRIANAIRIHEGANRVITMPELCEMTNKELKKIRNLGLKGQAVVKDECRNYLMENNDSEDST